MIVLYESRAYAFLGTFFAKKQWQKILLPVGINGRQTHMRAIRVTLFMDITKFITAKMTRKRWGIIAVAVICIAVVGIVALNPAKQLAKMRNDKRRSDAALILDAISQYSSDNNGFPVEFPQSPKEICRSGGNCSGLIDLGVLTTGRKYIPSLPVDPKNSLANGTGYQISENASGRITVSAISPEAGAVISMTR